MNCKCKHCSREFSSSIEGKDVCALCNLRQKIAEKNARKVEKFSPPKPIYGVDKNFYRYFIEQALLSKKYITNGSLNSSVDGSGIEPSVNASNAGIIFGYIMQQMPYVNWPESRVIDVGCGYGYLTKYLNERGIFCIGAEGAGVLESHFVDPDHTVLWDLTQDLTNMKIIEPLLRNASEKLFDVSFAFEVAEHVPFNLQDIFWRNLSIISRYHVCSIHVEGGMNDQHKYVISELAWKKYFLQRGVKVLKHIARREWVSKVTDWRSSGFFILEF